MVKHIKQAYKETYKEIKTNFKFIIICSITVCVLYLGMLLGLVLINKYKLNPIFFLLNLGIWYGLAWLDGTFLFNLRKSIDRKDNDEK